MRIIDKFGEDITNLADLEPYTHFIEAQDGKRSPVTRIVYATSHIEIEWGDPVED